MEAMKNEQPIPLVARNFRGVTLMVKARGFSKHELKEAEMAPYEARKHGIRVDIWRRTKHNENVVALKEWLKNRTGTERKRPRKQRSKS